MKFISTKEHAIKLGISVRRVQKMCEKNQIPGVQRVGRTILIPRNAIDTRDRRYMLNEIKTK